jgi:hypothetical protein
MRKFNCTPVKYVVSLIFSYLLGVGSIKMILTTDNTTEIVFGLFSFFIAIMTPYLLCEDPLNKN